MRMRSGKDVWQGWKYDLEKADEKPELGCGGKGDKETTDQVQRSQKMCESRTASLFVAREWDAQWGE